jgi:hypothetical protein
MFHKHFVAFLFRRERTVQIVLAFACGFIAAYLSTLQMNGGVNFGLGLTLAYLASHVFNIINIEWPAHKRNRVNIGIIRTEICNILLKIDGIAEHFSPSSNIKDQPKLKKTADLFYDIEKMITSALESVNKLRLIGVTDMRLAEILNNIEQSLKTLSNGISVDVQTDLLRFINSIYEYSRVDHVVKEFYISQGMIRKLKRNRSRL